MHPRVLTSAVALVVLPIFGCQTTAPIHAWTPPRLRSAVGRTLVMATIVGDRATASRLEGAIAANRPPEQSRSVDLVHQAELQSRSPIQLASSTPHIPSDLALMAAARQQGMDYLLIGEILEQRGAAALHPPPTAAAEPSSEAPTPGDDSATESAELPAPPSGPDRLTVSWRLIDVGEARVVGGVPVTVTTASAKRNHPDLADIGDAAELLSTAAARETWKLFVPSVRRTSVGLAKPYTLPGSSEVRRGNALAAAVRWREAEQIWRQVLEQHPRNHAALHNLAIAAAARQDFEQAKELAQSALRRHPSNDYERTVVWIEGRQRELFEAFQVPPPNKGWLFAPD